MFIRSERLFLRPAWPEDLEETFAIINDESVVRNLASAPWPYTRDDARDFLVREQDAMLPNFFITLPAADGAKVIGNIGLQRDHDDIEIGYWIARAHWGQGFATEAVRAVLSLARVLGHRHIVAGHFTDNPASGRVLEKAGFAATGRKRIRYSAGRCGVAPAIAYAIDLGAPCDCDSEDDVGAMHAA